MSRQPWDQYFLDLASLVATRSTCARRKVGCVLVDENKHIISTGHNGPPKGFKHCIDFPCEAAKLAGSGSPDQDGCLAVHAETNALLQLACKSFEGSLTLYTQITPCFTCAKNLCNSPVTRIVVNDWYLHKEVADLFSKAKISLTVLSDLSNE